MSTASKLAYATIIEVSFCVNYGPQSVQAHFQQRREGILAACDAYLAGAAAVGSDLPSSLPTDSIDGEASDSPTGNESGVPCSSAALGVGVQGEGASEPGAGAKGASEGFRLLLQQLKPRLVAAIDSLG